MKITPVHTTSYNQSKYQNFNGLTPSVITRGYDRFTDTLAKGMGKIIDTGFIRKFAEKFHNTNIATHIFSATGILISSFFILSTAKSKKIEHERKKPLMLNTAISCTIATIGGYTIDKLLNNPINKFTDSFQKANLNNPNLHKYLEGIKIAKSALIFGMIYKFAVPVFSMFLAEKVTEKNKKAAS